MALPGKGSEFKSCGTFGWKVRTGEVFWSAETCRILGYPRETRPALELIFDRIHPEDRDRVRQLFDDAKKTGTDLDFEHRLLMPDGAIRNIHTVAQAVGDNPGNLEYSGIAIDITDAKRVDEDLHESKTRFEEAQRVAHVGYWEWDLETGHLTWSDETYRIYGLTPQERPVDIEMLREMIHPEDREPMFRKAEEAMLLGIRSDAEHRIVRPGGEVRTVHSRADVKRDALGRPCQMFGTVQDITDRKRVEEELQAVSRDLRESNAKFEEAQRVAHVGYWIWHLDTDRVTWSDETFRIFGLNPQKNPIDLATVRDLIHPDDRELVFQTAEKAVRGECRPESEHRAVRPSGEIRIVYSQGDLKRDASGRPYEMFGTVQDITDRKRAEDVLKRTQFYLSEGQRLARMGSWASGDLGDYWSEEVYKIFGLAPGNASPALEQYLSIVHPQDRASMAETIRGMHEQHRGCDVTKRIVRSGGEVRYIRCVGIPVFEQEVFKGFHGTMIDVTEHELLTQELRREQAYLAEAQSLAHIGSWATNFATGQNFHISDETARLHGFDPRQRPIPLERFWATVLPEDEPAVRVALENAVRAGADYDISDFRICRADDSGIRFLRTIGHRNPSGEPGEYLGITMDITERKQAEEEHERLRQLEADLAHTNRLNMMGELAAALAHEIKQPIAASITSANACLRWLAHDPPNLERARAAATRMKDDGNRAADVINSLRTFYKKGAPPEPEVLNVKDIIQEMTVLLGNEAVRYSITIHPELDTDVPRIPGDRVQLQQVFMNLMLNAIEAMKDTGGELTIRALLNSEGQLVISISDTGVGLPAEDAERIFAAFHTTKPQGTGMGLAITRSIVESWGGRVWATANEGAGATFHFTLPREMQGHA
jgi:PAS domain S-box-containing protein